MSEIATFESVIVFIAWLGIMLWIFRPKSKMDYDKYCRIPLDNDDYKYNGQESESVSGLSAALDLGIREGNKESERVLTARDENMTNTKACNQKEGNASVAIVAADSIQGNL